jgi:hypothetical protein
VIVTPYEATISRNRCVASVSGGGTETPHQSCCTDRVHRYQRFAAEQRAEFVRFLLVSFTPAIRTYSNVIRRRVFAT